MGPGPRFQTIGAAMLAMLAACVTLAASGLQQDVAGARPAPARPPSGEPLQIADSLYLIPGGGANTAVFVAEAGVLVVDPKYPENGEAVVARIRRITAKPIRFVVNTHCHNDHFGGNLAMPMDAEIVMQEETAVNVARLRGTGEPATFEGRRVKTFKDRLTLFEGRDAVDLYFFGPAHTSGDAFVVFRQAGVMMTGDVFSQKAAPVMNLPWGGSPRDYAGTVRRAADLGGVTRIVSGHGPVYDREELEKYAAFNEYLLHHVQAEMQAGREWAQALKDLVLPPQFADYDIDRLHETFQDMYKGLAGR